MERHQRILSHRRHSPESFNVMVVGRRGVGKSTLLQTICDSFYSLRIESLSEGDRVMFPSATTKDSTMIAEEVLDPFCVFDSLSGTTLIRRCKVRIRDIAYHNPISVELIDTPGIDGHDEAKAAATINEICREVERRLQATLDEELKTRRDKSSFASAHIHAILYLLPPPVYYSSTTDSHSHRLDAAVDIVTEADLRAIRRLSQYANVIPAIGKCDTIEATDRKMLKNRSFYRELNELLMPARLFDYSDLPNTQREPRTEVMAYRRKILHRLPFQVCGSKHVDEWQQMRLPEYQTSSQSRVSVADWRVLISDHNRVNSSAAMITEGIFRNHRRQSSSGSEIRNPTAIVNAPTTSQRVRGIQKQQDEDRREALFVSATSSIQSLALRSNTVQIKRLHQRREVSLVREFSWGILQLNNPEHCDFALLVDILFHSFRSSLECWTDEVHYEKYRMQRIAADPNYFDISYVMATYLEQEQARRAVPVSTHHKSLGSQPRNSGSKHKNGTHTHKRSESHHTHTQRRHTTANAGELVNGNGNKDISIVSNAATAGNASSAASGFPLRGNTEESSTESSSGTNGSNGNNAHSNERSEKTKILNNAAQFNFYFPLPLTRIPGSPPDTAVTATTSATAATTSPNTRTQTPTAAATAAYSNTNNTNRPASANPHRNSAATTLTTIAAPHNPLSAPASPPLKPNDADTGSFMKRGLMSLLTGGNGSKASSKKAELGDTSQRGRRFTISAKTGSAFV
ncbi:hypothetical protein GGI25_002605 [Coemansia spiralis]|uniref:Septin-type G domain-containing protein n=2 Tax=Coemansia TaxID=4863 RepID=A0A9W8G8A0_9FUNG|nr:hypothetical protein EDC05_002905 [Coemansia umbellata]KAJ2623351.1 hypothetical protein GGI26_002389 [Coemansia sp. RSA 1358]KAJ2678101.1 hypothetical protein GGI25_002605 [Coemansia spiralis]